MLAIGTRVKCISMNTLSLYGKSGIVVSSIANRCKVLLDKDKGKVNNDLTLAYWFFTNELEVI